MKNFYLKKILQVTAMIATVPTLAATQVDIAGPTGSIAFGTQVVALPNGNIVVSDPEFSSGIGAVYLYSSAGTPMGKLTGATAGDHVGSGKIAVLDDGNFVVHSPDWDNGAVANAGAVTLMDASSNLFRVVHASNSLVGSSASDRIGSGGIVALASGYVVSSPSWDNGAVSDAGAATFGANGAGVVGTVTNSNSLVGSNAFDEVGRHIMALSNGHYVVGSPLWNNGTIADAGAATWGSGTTGVVGAVSSSNSLVGTAASDSVGGKAIPLSNGNYVIVSAGWDLGSTANVGAVTWGSGTSGVAGTISGAVSLIGSTANDRVGQSVTALTNGGYVVASPFWTDGAVVRAGAATWCNSSGTTVGAVTAGNSLIGSGTDDLVSISGVTALTNGNYVVGSVFWKTKPRLVPGVAVGAATWGNGGTGTTGVVDTINSLYGSAADDGVGTAVAALGNGNYVVSSPVWDLSSTVVDAGAATWGNGSTGTTGAVTSTNSLVGASSNDQVSINGVFALKTSNGHYVVASKNFDNGAAVNAGALTWGNGSGGTVGLVAATNSLVGSSSNDQVGDGLGVEILDNGHYVAATPRWTKPGSAPQAGAVTWCNGAGGTVGVINALNSLIGSYDFDNVGLDVYPLGNSGFYAVGSPNLDTSSLTDAGAVSLIADAGTVASDVNAGNSVIGTINNEMLGSFDFSYADDHLIVGRPATNQISLFYY